MNARFARAHSRQCRVYSLVARANHLCCAFCETPDSSDCSEAATEPQGYSAPTPIPSRKLNRSGVIELTSSETVVDKISLPTSAEHGQHSTNTVVCAGRGGREQGKETDNTSRKHLILVRRIRYPWSGRTTGMEYTPYRTCGRVYQTSTRR